MASAVNERVAQEILEGARLKVDRANQHIEELTSCAAKLPRHLYEIRLLGSDSPLVMDVDPGCFQLTFVPQRSISKHFALIMGDAIHNLRAAFDYANSQTIWISKGRPTPHPRKGNFPFWGSGQIARSAPGFCPLNQAIQALVPGANLEGLLRDKIRPCADGNAELWSISRLDNDDKHNFILPVVNTSNIDIGHIDLGSNRQIMHMRVNGNADYHQSLGVFSEPFSIKNYLNVTVTIHFSPQSVFYKNEEVIPTLKRLSQLTTNALIMFEEFLLSHRK